MPSVPLDHEYLSRLVASREEHGAVFPGDRDAVYVGDPAVARAVLANADGRFREHSDFFWTRRGVVCTRSEQVAIGRALRTVLRDRLPTSELPELVARWLAGSTSWPDAGNRLLLDVFRDALIGERPAPALRTVVELVVERAVLAGARDRQRWLARARLRARARRVLGAELRRRRTAPAGDRIDVLDAVVAAAPLASDRDLTEVFLACLFAVVGSLGFLLGWAVYLAGTTGSTAEPAWIVREALRLWPVAWLFARTPAAEHDLGGVAVTPRHDVLVCGYLVHRDPGHWPEPDEFRPQRWARPPRDHAFIPFGWGPHACTGAGLSLDVAERLLRLITHEHTVAVTTTGAGPQLAAALAPPAFTVRLDPDPPREEGR